MKNKKLVNNVINFAIKKEQESVVFYQNLQTICTDKKNQDLLESLETMEKTHIDILKNLKNHGFMSVRIENLIGEELANFKDPQTVQLPKKSLSFIEIVKLAIIMEDNLHNLYLKMAQQSTDPEAGKVYLRLAAEEIKHKLQLEQLLNYEDLE